MRTHRLHLGHGILGPLVHDLERARQHSQLFVGSEFNARLLQGLETVHHDGASDPRGALGPLLDARIDDIRIIPVDWLPPNEAAFIDGHGTVLRRFRIGGPETLAPSTTSVVEPGPAPPASPHDWLRQPAPLTHPVGVETRIDLHDDAFEGRIDLPARLAYAPPSGDTAGLMATVQHPPDAQGWCETCGATLPCPNHPDDPNDE